MGPRTAAITLVFASFALAIAFSPWWLALLVLGIDVTARPLR